MSSGGKLKFFVFVDAVSSVVEDVPRKHVEYRLWFHTGFSEYYVGKTVGGIQAHIPRVANVVINHHMATSDMGRASDVVSDIAPIRRKKKISDEQMRLL